MCTAAALWKLGKFDEAVGWVQKAAQEAAGSESQPSSNVRVVRLTIAAAELAHYVREWQQGEEADPKSVAISLDFDTDAIDVQSLPSGVIEIDSTGKVIEEPQVPAQPPPIPKTNVQPPKLPPRARTFAGTMPQDARNPLAAPKIEPKIEEKKPLAPRKGSPSLSRTLPEAMSSPLARRPSSAGPLGDKPRTPDAPKAPVVLDLGKKRALTPDPFASLDEPRLTPPKETEPAIEPALTRRMDDVPTRRIAEGEAWPPADIDDERDAPKRK